MTTPQYNDHAWFEERVAAYLAGGLGADERARFERHRDQCPPCADVLAATDAADREMMNLFAAERPAPGFEDRAIRRFRDARAPWVLRHPATWRIGSAVAAALLLGGIGVGTSYLMGTVGFPRPDIAFLGKNATAPATKPATTRPGKWALNGRTANGPAHASGSSASSTSGWRYAVSDGPALRTLDSAVEGVVLEKTQEVDPKQVADQRDKTVLWDDRAARPTDGNALFHKERSRGSVATFAAPPTTHDFGLSAGVSGNGLGRRELETVKAIRSADDGIVLTDADQAARSPVGEKDSIAPASGPQSERLAEAGKEGFRTAGVDEKKGLEASFKYGYMRKEELNFAVKAPERFKPALLASTENGTAFGRGVTLGIAAGQQGQGKGGQHASGESLVQLGEADKRSGEEREEREKLGRAANESAPRAQAAGGTGGAVAAGDGAVPAPVVAPVIPVVAPPPPPQPATAAQQAGRKIIRTGEMDFEVDGFDSAFAQVAKIADEEKGFIASTNSEKLTNGKMKGAVVVRIPPDHLDTFVLKLRALGELKGQRIVAQDVGKQYTDVESSLRASRAMEERLLKIIQDGKGEIKDLIAAEKQLGEYRERIERLVGEIRYYDSQIALSTLTITLVEKAIGSAAAVTETERVNAGVEVEDVEAAYADALKAIDAAKGRVVSSDLKKFDAGQFAATITCDVNPDNAGALIDRLKQLGRVARLDVERRQATPEGATARPPGARVDRKDTRFAISIYNLANIAPRETVNLNMAVEDVEAVYRDIQALVSPPAGDPAKPEPRPAAGKGLGRVVSSTLTRPRADQVTGVISLEIATPEAARVLEAIRTKGEVMRLTRTENADTANVTRAKQGIQIQLFSLAQVAPRETTSLQVFVKDVPAAFAQLSGVVRKGVEAKKARILTSQLNEADRTNVSGTLDFEVRVSDRAEIDTAIGALGIPMSRSVTSQPEGENLVTSKVRIQIAFYDEAQLTPRESISLTAATPDVKATYDKLRALLEGKGRIANAQLVRQAGNQTRGVLEFVIARADLAAIEAMIDQTSDVPLRNVARAAESQRVTDAKVAMSLQIISVAQIAPREVVTLGVDVRDVPAALSAVSKAAEAAGGVASGPQMLKDDDGGMKGTVTIDVPVAQVAKVREEIEQLGTVRVQRSERNANVPDGKFTHARFDVTLGSGDVLTPGEKKLGSTVWAGLKSSGQWLLWSLYYVLAGLLFLVPWALLLWLGYRIYRARRPAPETVESTIVTPTAPPPAT